MKLELNLLQRRRSGAERRAPSHLFGGRVRTSTLVLIVLFLALWWTYDTYGPHQQRSDTPPTQVVPPGFLPDPNYTWVPRTRVDPPPPAVTRTPTTTTPTTTPPPVTTTTTTPPPPLPTLPCLLPPPFCPATSSPATPTPAPPPGLVPTPSAVPSGPSAGPPAGPSLQAPPR